ncbi:MmgE/PrpD family protein [Rhizobium sp. Root482]|uniref:MmgE/PrpD family protein n=1 Tax=Rhizobium sp. Root482 TaxID=1736543 RepID=UPI001910F61A|nr:MmgE/PrpD family protein [Rhizobium sp. Root482]
MAFGKGRLLWKTIRQRFGPKRPIDAPSGNSREHARYGHERFPGERHNQKTSLTEFVGTVVDRVLLLVVAIDTTNDETCNIKGKIMNEHVRSPSDLQGLTRRFAKLAAELRYEDLPAPVQEKAKLIIRDGVGNQIAASAISEAAIAIIQLVQEWGGKPESTIVGYGDKVPAPLAALCNGAMGHGVELDDAHGSGLIKAGSVLIPAAFAAAEISQAKGDDVVSAVVAGYEIAIRVAKAINPGHRHRGYHTTSTVSLMGAAVITARLLGCDEEGIANAIGLAAMQSSGIQSYLDDPCMAKPFGPGKGAFNGVLAGIMASRGFTGPKKVLESKEGFFNAFTDSVRISDLLDGFGSKFAIMEVGFKPHAACRYAHGPIDLAQMFHADGVKQGDISSITVKMSGLAIRQASKFPCGSLNAAMGSTQFGVALALTAGGNGLRDYWDGYSNQAVHDLAAQVVLEAEPEFGVGGRQAVVTLGLKDGRSLSYRSEEPRGEPANPLSGEELERKFMSTAGLVLDEEAISDISRRLMSLELEPNAAIIPSLTVARDRKPVLRAA